MPYTTYSHNPTTAQAIPASWGDDVVSNTDFLANRPCVVAYSTATQTFGTSGASADLLFPSESFDIGGWHSTSVNTDHFSVPSGLGGKVRVEAGGQWAADADGHRTFEVTVNGSSLTPARVDKVNAASTGVTTSYVRSGLISVSAGDVIRINATQTSGNSLTIDEYWVSIEWVCL